MIEKIQSTNMAVILALLLVILCTASRVAAWISERIPRQDRRFDARMRRRFAEWGVQTAMAEGKYAPGTAEYTGDIVGADREAIIREARDKIDRALSAWANHPEIQSMVIHEMLEERVRIVCAMPRFDRRSVPHYFRQRTIVELEAMAEWLQERKAS